MPALSKPRVEAPDDSSRSFGAPVRLVEKHRVREILFAVKPSAKEHKRFHLVVEIILYPFHFIARAMVRAILLLAAIGALVAASIVIVLLLDGVSHWAKHLDTEATLGVPLNTFGLLASLGVLATVLTTAGRAIRKSLRDIFGTLIEILRGWMPRLNAREGFAVAWDEARGIGDTFRHLFFAPYKLALPLSIVAFLVFFAVRAANDEANWRKHVRDTLDSPTVVVVVPVDGKQAIPPPALRPGTMFAVAHAEQGSLATGEGICLGISEPWLVGFKAALTECATSTTTCRPKLLVRAFASGAPIRDDDNEPVAPEAQEDLNCEIANRRAEEVVHFLLHSSNNEGNRRYECQAKVNRLEPYRDGTLCKRHSAAFEFGQDDGLAFDLRYEPWQSHGAMAAEKPADDGAPPRAPRKPGVEFFNRSVQLTLTNYACGQNQCEGPAPLESGLNAEEGEER